LLQRISYYFKDPLHCVAICRILKVTVLGEVKKSATFLVIQTDGLILSKHLGLAGDLTIYGRRE